MLIPPGIPLSEAIKPLIEAIKKLEQGIDVYDCTRRRVVNVKGAVSILLGDLVQAAAFCNHLGNPALKNCKTCWVEKKIAQRGTN